MAKTLNFTAEEINERLAAVPTDYTATLTTTWSGSTALYTQNVAISGITSTDRPIVDIVVDVVSWETQEAEWAKIVKAESYNGGIKFYAKEKTTAALSINVKVVR